MPGEFEAFGAAPLVPILIIAVLLLHPWDRLNKVRQLAERAPSAVVTLLAVVLVVIAAA